MTHPTTSRAVRRRRFAAALGVAAAAATAGPAARADVPTYTFSYAGFPATTKFGDADAINAAGVITVDGPGPSGASAAYLYNASTGSLTLLPSFGGKYNVPYAINAAGQVTGNASTADGDPATGFPFHAFLYSNGTVTDLGTLGGANSVGVAINAGGTVVGTSNAADPNDPSVSDSLSHAVVVPAGGKMTALATLDGHQTYANGINDAGVIVGSADTSATTSTAEVYHAVTWTDGVITDLGTLGGSISSAQAVNNAGQIVGFSYTADDAAYEAFLYSNGVMTSLGSLGGGLSVAIALNDAGLVVGSSFTAAQAAAGYNSSSATLFEGGQAYDLNALAAGVPAGWTLADANGVNDAGQIVGDAYDGAGVEHAFLLTPSAVPEPAAVGGVGLAAAGLAARRRRRA